MKNLFYLWFFFLFSQGIQATETTTIRVVSVPPAINSDEVLLKIIFPRPYENKRKKPVNVQLRLENFPLGIPSEDNRSKEVHNYVGGQKVHVIIDNEPYLIYNQSIKDTFFENGEYFDKLISFSLPGSLQQGSHYIRCFPAHSYGESIKGSGCLATEVFYYQDLNRVSGLEMDINKPYLTYNEPQGKFTHHESTPLLLDFYISNCALAIDGYKVALWINDNLIQKLTEWTPYYIYGLNKGTHQIKLELLDANDEVVPGFFNVVERAILLE